ncbi:MAG: anaerobic sulfite reductase subunit AsrB [Planctomycetes bacterium]|nr:anaerobic sulfite reductase subunit AsrB [Planctomycetota bacterium]
MQERLSSPPNPYAGAPAEILRVHKHTPTERSFELARAVEGCLGQFVMLSLPMAGEFPVSISGFAGSSIEVTVRNVGRVTSELFRRRQGDSVYLRGPYGRGFPLAELEGHHVLIIAGGSALAAAKPLVEHCLGDNPPGVKRLDLLVGFRSPKHILFRSDLRRWGKRCSTVVTVDHDEDHEWMGAIGFVVDYVQHVEHLGPHTRVVLIGPPLMMANTVRELLRHGIREENIWLSLERHMRCGIGKCGHCRIRDKYVCTDGPVFRYDEAKLLLD